MAEEATGHDNESAAGEEQPQATAESRTGEERVYKQEDVDSITAKVRESERKRAAKLEAEVEKLRQQTMSEQEKTVEAARKETEERVRREYEQKLRAESLKTMLAAKGLDTETASRLVKLAPDEWDDPQEVLSDLEQHFAPLFKSNGKRVAAGGDAPPRGTQEGVEYTPEYVQQQLQAIRSPMKRAEWLREHRKEVDAWKDKNIGPSAAFRSGTSRQKG